MTRDQPEIVGHKVTKVKYRIIFNVFESPWFNVWFLSVQWSGVMCIAMDYLRADVAAAFFVYELWHLYDDIAAGKYLSVELISYLLIAIPWHKSFSRVWYSA